MGRSIIVARYEITPEIKELQELASTLIPIGYSINIDITKDLVTVNGCRKFTRAEAKDYMLEVIEGLKDAMVTADVPDTSIKLPKVKKPRIPGAPSEERTIIRRAKRIFVKAIRKNIDRSSALVKSMAYITKKSSDETTANRLKQLVEQWSLTK